MSHAPFSSSPSRQIRSLCVYCGSNPGRDELYADGARGLARTLVGAGIDLVYGGSSVGLMGIVADEVLQLGGRAIGVIPEVLMKKELAHERLTRLEVVDSMHARKLRMADLSDAFIAMPGGVGTLEEIFEIWTWAQLGMHTKPCGLLNTGGYYDALVQFLDRTVDAQFVRPWHRQMLLVDEDPAALLRQFHSYVPPVGSKWVQKEQT